MPDRRFVTRAAGAVLLCAILAGCQATNSDGSLNVAGGLKALSGESYTFFWDQGDHLKELLDAGKFDDAGALYAEHTAFFAARHAKQKPQLQRLADHANGRHGPAVAAALSSLDHVAWPAPEADWPDIRARVADATAALAAYDAETITGHADFRLPQADRLGDRLDDLRAGMERDAAQQFAGYDLIGGTHFFEAYPVDVDRRDLFAEAGTRIGAALGGAGASDIQAFAARYGRDAMPEATWQTVSNAFVGAHLRENAAAADMNAVLAAIAEARRSGLEPTETPGMEVAFVEVTSESLLRAGQIDFPAEVELDLPVRVTAAELDDALTNAAAQEAGYVIVFDVALAEARRRIKDKEFQRSRFIAGYRTEPNPEYNVLQNKIHVARMEVQNAAIQGSSYNNQNCYGVGCLGAAIGQFAAGIAKMNAEKELESLMGALQRTPLTVSIPVYQDYRYDKATVEGTKTMTVHYHVIDRRAGTYFKSTFDVEEKKNFSVAYAVHPKDPARNDIFAGADSEETVAEWEEAPATVALSQLVDHYLASGAAKRPLPDLATLRTEMLADKNRALARYEAARFDARPLNDPRFDSVVVVLSRAREGLGNLGSGFFIAPDLVLTNYHVVEQSTFVEMKMYDGQETFGKVIATDAIRDLAAVRVQRRGKPVAFFEGRTLDLGASVDVIGHPKGLEFSITRGVISALRRDSTVVLAGNRQEILFIQTDAPVNTGNSGGPLFLGDRVIGVNTQGMKKHVSEGLNFAVHYSEVRTFLRENLPNVRLATGERS